MKNRKIGINYIVDTVYQLSSIIIPLITLPYLSRVLGAEGIGLYSYNYSIVSYFILFAALGTGSFGMREVAYRQDDKMGYSKAFWEIFYLRLIFTSISACIYILFSIIFGKNKLILLILLPNLINVIFDVSWLWSGLEKFIDIAYRCFSVKLLYLPLIFIFVKSADDIYKYILIEVVISVLINLILWVGLRNLIVKVKDIHPFIHFKPVIKLFLPSLAVQIYTVLDKTMIGIFSTDSYAENGYYEQAQGIVKSCLILVSSMVSVMRPVIAQCFASGDKELMKNYLYKSYRYVWLITLLLANCIFVISSTLVPLFFGPGFEKVSILIKVCCPLLIVIGLSNVTGLQYFVPCDKITQHTISLIIGASLNFILNIILIPNFKSTGAAFASVLAESCVTLSQFYFVAKLKELKIHKIFSSSIKYIIASIVSFIVGIFIINIGQPSWIKIILTIVLMIFTYFSVLLVIRDEVVVFFLKKRFPKKEKK